MWVRGLKQYVVFSGLSFSVAPHVGAWIETPLNVNSKIILWSHPMWVRGLKLDSVKTFFNQHLSHPMWVRGLKPQYIKIVVNARESHPMWVRGLKQLKSRIKLKP